MFHLNWKDNLFLVGITLLMIFVALVFSATWKGVGTKSGDAINQKSEEKTVGNIFDCEGDKFQVNKSPSYFKLDKFINIKPGIALECVWASDDFVVIYIKGDNNKPGFANDTRESFMDDLKNKSEVGEVIELGDSVEAEFFDNEKQTFGATKLLFGGNYIYIMGLNSLHKVGLNDPEFRSFVDSFELVK